jgi:hypothetical protein
MPLAYQALLTKKCLTCKKMCFKVYNFFLPGDLCGDCFSERYERYYDKHRFRSSLEELEWDKLQASLPPEPTKLQAFISTMRRNKHSSQ